jgi:hypothetical protein
VPKHPTRPTAKIPVTSLNAGDKLVIELSDPEDVAAFFDLVAKLLREKKKITLTVE